MKEVYFKRKSAIITINYIKFISLTKFKRGNLKCFSLFYLLLSKLKSGKILPAKIAELYSTKIINDHEQLGHHLARAGLSSKNEKKVTSQCSNLISHRQSHDSGLMNDSFSHTFPHKFKDMEI